MGGKTILPRRRQLWCVCFFWTDDQLSNRSRFKELSSSSWSTFLSFACSKGQLISIPFHLDFERTVELMRRTCHRTEKDFQRNLFSQAVFRSKSRVRLIIESCSMNSLGCWSSRETCTRQICFISSIVAELIIHCSFSEHARLTSLASDARAGTDERERVRITSC